MSNSNALQVLMAGGCGYIGSALVPWLLGDDRVPEVVVFDSLAFSLPTDIARSVTKDLTFLHEGILEYPAVKNAIENIDVVIHFTAITGSTSAHGREAEVFGVNRDSTANLVRATSKSEIGNVVLAFVEQRPKCVTH